MDERRGPFLTPPELWVKLKPIARQMRHDPTQAEDILWQRLRRKVLGVNFRRQHTIGRFIVDFYCPAARLIVEVDGPIHQNTQDEDAIRQEFLEAQELRVLRFANLVVMQDTDAVVDRIRCVVQERTPPPDPLPTSGEGE